MNQELILKEVAASLAQRKRLADKTQKLHSEVEMCGSTKCCTTQKGADPLAKTPPKLSKSSSVHISHVGSDTGGSRGSPWKRNDGQKNKSSKNDKNQPENAKTFDAHLKNIITNALMGENNADKSSQNVMDQSPQKKGPSAKSHQVERKSPGKKEKHPSQPAGKELLSMDSVQDSAIRMSLMRNSSPDRYQGTGLKRSPGDSDTSRITTAGGMPSIKVTIPLGEARKRPPSLPVSIPLSSVRENLSLLNRDGHSGARKDSGQKPVVRNSSPVMRDSYSPISRPSSSSSTISSESVKHLEHGSKVPATSPKGATVNTSLMDSVPAVQANAQSSLAKQLMGAHTTTSVSGKDSDSSTFSALLLQDKRHAGMAHMPMPAMMPPGAVFPFLMPDKEMFLKMMQNGPRMPYAMPPAELVARAAYFGLGLPANGLVQGAPGQEKNTNSSKRNRKRKPGSKYSGGGGGVGIKESAGASSRMTMPNLSGHETDIKRGGCTMGQRTGHGNGGVIVESQCKGSKMSHSRPAPNASYIEDIVSNASQPLAISAISDVESTKSSPLVEMVDKTGTIVPVVALYIVCCCSVLFCLYIPSIWLLYPTCI